MIKIIRDHITVGTHSVFCKFPKVSISLHHTFNKWLEWTNRTARVDEDSKDKRNGVIKISNTKSGFILINYLNNQTVMFFWKSVRSYHIAFCYCLWINTKSDFSNHKANPGVYTKTQMFSLCLQFVSSYKYKAKVILNPEELFAFFLLWLFTPLHSEWQVNQAFKWLKQQSQDVAPTLHFGPTLTGISVTLSLEVQVFQALATQNKEYYNTINYIKKHRKVHQTPSAWLKYLWLKRNLNTVSELTFFWRRGRGKGNKVHVVLNLTEDPVLLQPFLQHLLLKT